ncbi:MAG: branched-chain alpha-keto acid dehydrogenase subunit [Proteobacteria bacterium]|nr:branched-chain alpha-keto acid dehydrogenase subunit [Pseudomonadota bacterium]
MIDICVPDIGDYQDVPIIEVMVAVGDTIGVDTPLLILESDKATMEVPASAAGTVSEIIARVGQRVSRGSLILRLAPALAASCAPADERLAVSPPAASGPAAVAVAAALPIGPPPGLMPRCGPAVRKLARELGVDLAQVVGSGPQGRLQKEDVLAWVKHSLLSPVAPTAAPSAGGLDLLAWPSVDFEKFGPVERRARSRLQKMSAANLHRNWVMIPHVTNFDAADITELDAFRQQINGEPGADGVKLTLLAFLIKAVVRTLQAYPAFNSSLDGTEMVYKNYWHIGFAAETADGLVVPVIRHADGKSLQQVARECAELAGLARLGKLKPEQMQGGCFTISSLGGIGGTAFTPIINAPEVAILGVTRASLQARWTGSVFAPRLMLPLCLSWDHRAVDGAAAARFLVHLSSLLSDLRRMIV